MNNLTTRRSVYRRGADDGLWFGIYLSVLFIMSVCTVTTSPLFEWPTITMAIAVPVIIYILLRRSYREDNFTSDFSALWLHGICIFFFGCTIMALTVFIYLRFVNPAFFADTIAMLLDMADKTGMPSDSESLILLNAVQKNNAYPTAGQSAMQMLMSGVFSGSILSMIITLIVKSTARRPTPPPIP